MEAEAGLSWGVIARPGVSMHWHILSLICVNSYPMQADPLDGALIKMAGSFEASAAWPKCATDIMHVRDQSDCGKISLSKYEYEAKTKQIMHQYQDEGEASLSTYPCSFINRVYISFMCENLEASVSHLSGAVPGCVGACWAFASTAVLNDRMCITRKEDALLSPQVATTHISVYIYMYIYTHTHI